MGISRRHALVGHGSSGNLYVMDLGSSHGTFVNKQRLQKKKREVVRDGYVVKFGASTREYIVKLDLDANDGYGDNDASKTKQNSKKRKLEKTESERQTNGGPTKKAKVEKVSFDICWSNILNRDDQNHGNLRISQGVKMRRSH